MPSAGVEKRPARCMNQQAAQRNSTQKARVAALVRQVHDATPRGELLRNIVDPDVHAVLQQHRHGEENHPEPRRTARVRRPTAGRG